MTDKMFLELVMILWPPAVKTYLLVTDDVTVFHTTKDNNNQDSKLAKNN